MKMFWELLYRPTHLVYLKTEYTTASTLTASVPEEPWEISSDDLSPIIFYSQMQMEYN